MFGPLNVLYVEVVAEAFARHELRVVHLGVELVHRHAFVLLVGRHQQVEVQREADRRFENRDQRLLADLRLAEIHRPHRVLLLAFGEVAAFAVDEDAADQVTFVGVAVEFERVGQEVVDVDKSAVGVVAVGLHVGVLPDEVVGAELEDVGVHLEDQDVVGYLQLGLELAAVAVFEPHAAVEFAVQFVVHLRGHLQQRLLQGVERSEGVVENPLFECRLADDGVENLCSQRGCFHGM